MNRPRTFFNGFVAGAVLTGAAGWYFVQQARQHPQTQQRFEQAAADATTAAGEVLYQSGVAFKSKLESLDLTTAQVKEELARTGKVVRRRAQELAGQMADATADAGTTAAIKAKFAADSDLSVWTISVSTTDGQVVLNGSVSSADLVAKAVALALDTTNVRDVTSNLKVETKTP